MRLMRDLLSIGQKATTLWPSSHRGMDAAHRAPATPHPKNERGRGRRATGRVQDPSSGADAPGAAPPARPVAARPHGDMPAAARHRAAGNAV